MVRRYKSPRAQPTNDHLRETVLSNLTRQRRKDCFKMAHRSYYLCAAQVPSRPRPTSGRSTIAMTDRFKTRLPESNYFHVGNYGEDKRTNSASRLLCRWRGWLWGPVEAGRWQQPHFILLLINACVMRKATYSSTSSPHRYRSCFRETGSSAK